MFRGEALQRRKKAVGPYHDEDLDSISIPLMEDEKSMKLMRQTSINFNDQKTWIIPGILTIMALWTRLYKIGWADYVVWDEAHFGKFASYYIKREFYFDVHPPLGKILLGFSGVLAGYNGSFPFESGAKYPEHLNYGVMRIFAATFGAGMVPAAYFTGLQLQMSKASSILLASMVLMDTATLTISRFILLDSMLLFFTSLSVMCLVTFRNYQRSSPLSPEWYYWLGATGLSLGAVASVKWVGLFAIALVGLYTISDLWDMLGDLEMPKAIYIRHWVFRILLLIVLPVSVYLFCFQLHFWILNRSGTGDAQMSSLFQAGLKGNDYYKNPLELAYGSKVTLKNNGRGGGLLHSHTQKYPTGSMQQQVTCYHHKDNNNNWFIYKSWDTPVSNSTDIDYVKNGDIVRLVHEQSGRNLHSHFQKAPVSASEYEVSCYGNSTFGDKNDHWKIEIVDDLHDWRPVRIKALTTRFRLRHLQTNCLLRSGGVTLPEWGFKQAEVACQAIPDNKSRNNMWNIEQHWNDKLPPGGSKAFRRNFIRDFADLNVAMWNSNNALTPDPDREPDQITSSAYQWPFALVGLRMCGWGDKDVKFFLLGHPLIWWGSSISLGVFALVWFFYVVREHRKIEDWKHKSELLNFLNIKSLRQRQVTGKTFLLPAILHHYFPALYFAIITFAVMVDHMTSGLHRHVANTLIYALIAVLLCVYLYFADFAFGIGGPSKDVSEFRHTYGAVVADNGQLPLTVKGVLWNGDTIIDRAPEVIQFLRSKGKKVLFVTNNSSKSRASYVKKFHSLGIQAETDDIFGSAYAAAYYIKHFLNISEGKKVYVCGMAGLEEELAAENIKFVGASADNAPIESMSDIGEIQPDDSVEAVLFGFDLDFNYRKLATAFTYIKRNTKCHFLATNCDLTYPTGGSIYPGTGALLSSLTAPLKRQPTVIDILFGQKGGLKTLLVLTGT
ncbi:Protein O-mannosyltransferase 2 [Dinochytrium kinnereticum]|nr:Protein O-mannosyltransferase 2 [Dinochytrium kinnereticum]